MNIKKIDNWLNAIIYEDGHRMSAGSLRTIELIRKECCISQAPKEPEAVHGNEAEKVVCEAALRIVEQFMLQFRTKVKELDVSNEDKRLVLTRLGWSSDSFETH